MNLMFFQKVWCYQNRASRNWNFEVNVKVIQFGSRSHKEVVLKQCSFLHRLTVKGSEVRLGPLSKDLKTTRARACTKVPTFGTWNEVESAEISFPVAPTWHRQLPEIWPRAWTPELLVQRADVFLDFKLDRCTRATVAARLELYDSYCFSSCTADAFIYQPGSSPCKRCSAGILMTQGFCGWHVEVGDCRTLEETQLKASRFVRMFLRQWFSPSFWVWYSWRFNQATCLMGYSWDAVWLFRGHVGQKKQRASGTPGQSRKMMWMGADMFNGSRLLWHCKCVYVEPPFPEFPCISTWYHISQWPLDKRCRTVCMLQRRGFLWSLNESLGELGQLDKDQGTLLPMQSWVEWVDFSAINCQRLWILWSKS